MAVEGVRLGLVGLGRMGHFHAVNLAGRVPHARLVRIADANEAVARGASEELGVAWSTEYEAGYGYECSSEIMGSQGTLCIGDHRRTAVQTLTPGRACRDYVSNFVERFADAYRLEMEHFVRAVRGETEPEAGGADDAARHGRSAPSPACRRRRSARRSSRRSPGRRGRG